MGKTDNEIAESLCISARTVNRHVISIFSKCNIHDRKKLIYEYDQEKMGSFTHCEMP